MNPQSLKYGEIFAFLAFIFLILILATRADLRQTQEAVAQASQLEADLARAQDAAARARFLQQELQAARTEARRDRRRIANLQERLADLESAATERDALAAELEIARATIDELPPIVVLSETDRRYAFDVGSAEIPPDFRRTLLEEIIPLLEEYSRDCGCDAIEVIGHTDGLPVGGQSNLDRQLIAAFNRAELPTLVPGSNLDLGMLRALAIVRVLKAAQREGALPNIRYFLPYSAGQMLRLDRTLELESGTESDSQRRRIELRLLDSAAWKGSATTTEAIAPRTP